MDKKTSLKNELRCFAKRISVQCPLAQMYLFGSRARGTAKKWSDVDLLLVSKAFQGKKSLKRAPPLHMAWDLEYPVDFICLTPKEFEAKKKEFGIVQEVLKHGIRLI